MTFFYDLNKKLSDLAARQTLNEGKGDGNLANNAKPYDKVTRGDVIAGRLGKDEMGGKPKKQVEKTEESAFQAAIGKKKYGDEGMKALQKAGRDNASAKTMSNIRNKYDKYDEDVMDVAKKVGGVVKKVANKALDTLGHGSDEELIRKMQKDAGLPQTGKKPEQVKEVGDTPAGLAAVQRVGQRADRAIGDAGTGYSGSELDNPDKTYAARDRANAIAGRERIRATDKNPTRVVGGPNHGNRMEEGLPMVKGPNGKMVPKFAADGKGKNDLQGKKSAQANESIKLIAVKEGADKTVRVYRDTAYNEFHVRVFHKGQEVVESRYFTESQDDAITTADYMVEGAFTMTPKQKSFAKLAPPTDKITFADKIAGAKKEVDEMLGDVAAEAMKKALGGGRGRNSEMVEADDEDDVYAYQDDKKKKSHKTASGGTVTRHGGVTRHQAAPGHYGGYDPETDPDKDDDKPGTSAGDKRKAGRPKGTGKRIGAKGPSGKSKLMTREGPDDLADQGEYDQEGDMALDDINTIESAANELQSIIDANENLPEWVQSKINKAMDYLDTARDYMAAQQDDDQIVEKAVSKKQQKFMGMVHAAQKGEKPASKEVAKVAKSMGKKDAEDFAATKHKGLPEKKKPEGNKKEESVEENTVAGSVAPAMGGKAPKGKGGMTFGKGVYEGALAESFNSKLKTVLNEGMSVNMSADQDGKKSLTVTATDDDAVKLSQLLNLAGIGGQSQGYGSVCPGCGSSDCGCDQMQEDLANSAENTMYTDTDYMVNGLSGGLDGQKTDQSTLGTVINQDPRRTIGSVAESNDVVELYKRIA